MESNGLKLDKFILKLISIFVVSIMVSMIMLTNVDTYSWFTSSFSTDMIVSAASTEDILAICEIITDDEGNATAIKLQKNERCTQVPVIYFSVTGEVSKYILHINPVKLDSYEEFYIPIRICLHYGEEKGIWGKRKGNIPIAGNIKIKYLNEFIDEDLPICLKPLYIYSFKDNPIVPNYSEFLTRQQITFASTLLQDSLTDEDYNQYFYDSIMDLAIQKSWDEAVWIYSDNYLTEEEVTYPISKIELSDEQNSIMDIIVPTLKEYIDRLYGVVEDLIKQLNEKLAQIGLLNARIAELEEENAKLITENQTFAQTIEELRQTIAVPGINTGSKSNSDMPPDTDTPQNTDTAEKPETNPPGGQDSNPEIAKPIGYRQEPAPSQDNQNPDSEGGSEAAPNDEDTSEPTKDTGTGTSDNTSEGESPGDQDTAAGFEEATSDEDADEKESDEGFEEQPIEVDSEDNTKQQEINPSTMDVIDKLYDTDTINTIKDDAGGEEDDDSNEGSEYSGEQNPEPFSQEIRNMAMILAKYKSNTNI